MAINATSSRAATVGDQSLASGRVGFIARNDTQALAQAARAAGMSSLGNNEYQSADGSWIRMNGNGTIDRGVNGTQFSGMPQNAAQQRQPAQRQPAQRAQPAQRGGTQWTAAWFQQNVALARLPIMSGGSAQNAASLQGAGFVQSGNSWSHSDGSRVDFAGGAPALSYQGTPLGNLPRWW